MHFVSLTPQEIEHARNFMELTTRGLSCYGKDQDGLGFVRVIDAEGMRSLYTEINGSLISPPPPREIIEAKLGVFVARKEPPRRASTIPLSAVVVRLNTSLSVWALPCHLEMLGWDLSNLLSPQRELFDE